MKTAADDRIESFRDALESETDVIKIAEIRGSIRELRSLVQFPTNMINQIEEELGNV